MAHVHGRPDNQQEHLDDILGRGPGDPDVYGYPGEDKPEASPSPKVPSKNTKRQTSIKQSIGAKKA